MGRMSDARKRAQKKGAGETPTPPSGQEPKTAAGGWVAREESLVFPDVSETSPPDPGQKRIALPSSGLAADILAREEARSIEATPPKPAPTPVAPVPETSPSAAQAISFFAAPAREEKKTVEATEHLVTFFLGDEEYALDVRLVQEIIRVSEITQVPRAPDFIKGVINLRGRIIPVVDLKRKLDLGEVDPASRLARIVVIKLKERLVGLLVDGASQVLKVPISTIEAAPEEVVEVDANYIRGVAKLEKRLIILMDLSKILAVELRESESISSV